MKRLLLLASVLLASTAFAANWPAWRGPLGTGVTEETELPVKWSRTENVKWQVPLPEAGNSTPVVWGDRIFLTQPVKERRTLMCFNRADGKLLWQQGVTAKEKEPTHGTNPYASQSPVTDGERSSPASRPMGSIATISRGRNSGAAPTSAGKSTSGARGLRR